MNREILFRGKRKNDGKRTNYLLHFTYGFLLGSVVGNIVSMLVFLLVVLSG